MKITNCAVEEWAKMVRDAKVIELNKSLAEAFAICVMTESVIDKDQELIDNLENKKCGVASAFWLRVKHCHTYTVSPSLVVFLSEILTSFHLSTMFANYFQYVAHKNGLVHIGLREFSFNAFPYGLPTDDEWQRLWDAQKVDFKDLRDIGGSDNILDHSQCGESIRQI